MFEFFNLPAAIDSILENKRKKMKSENLFPPTKADKYLVNEIFYSVQGEGFRTGTANTFVRFANCNLKCDVGKKHSDFSCDTEFSSGVWLSAKQIVDQIEHLTECKNVILTGGEPALQVDGRLINLLKDNGFFVAIETNGTIDLPSIIDWICCSPKSAEHTLKLKRADELRYVRNVGQGIPKPVVESDNLFISPAFEPDGSLKNDTLQHCVSLVKANPQWRLSLQIQKFLNIR